MGGWPYDCKICGGAYQACGRNKPCEEHKEDNSLGSQFCWEEFAVMTPIKLYDDKVDELYDKKVYKLPEYLTQNFLVCYDGYGGFNVVEESPNKLPENLEFEFFQEYDSYVGYTNTISVLVDVVCLRCYNKTHPNTEFSNFITVEEERSGGFYSKLVNIKDLKVLEQYNSEVKYEDLEWAGLLKYQIGIDENTGQKKIL